jgi:hypothetical protein
LSEDLQHAVAALESKVAQMREESAARARRRTSSGLSTTRRANHSLPRTPTGGRGGDIAAARAAGTPNSLSSVVVASPLAVAGSRPSGPAAPSRFVFPSPTPSPTASSQGGVGLPGSPGSSGRSFVPGSNSPSPAADNLEASTTGASPLSRVLRVMVFMVRGAWVVGEVCLSGWRDVEICLCAVVLWVGWAVTAG